MTAHRNRLDSDEPIPDPEEIRNLYPIEDDADTIEPPDEAFEELEINTEDTTEMEYWAAQFQISEEALRMAIALNGNRVNQLRRYLNS